jgi:hypothetical protein
MNLIIENHRGRHCYVIVHRGRGSTWTPLKTTFPHEFFNENYTIYLYTKDNHIPAKKNEY